LIALPYEVRWKACKKEFEKLIKRELNALTQVMKAVKEWEKANS